MALLSHLLLRTRSIECFEYEASRASWPKPKFNRPPDPLGVIYLSISSKFTAVCVRANNYAMDAYKSKQPGRDPLDEFGRSIVILVGIVAIATIALILAIMLLL